MKKTVKTIAIFTVLMMLATLFICMNVSAAGSTIAVSSKSVQVGQTITFTVTINGDEAMYATEADFTYDPAVLKFNSGDSANGGNGSVHIVGTPGGSQKQSYTLSFTALSEGSCTVSMSNVKYVGNDEVSVNGSSVPGITVKAVQQPVSNNANLSSLTVSAGKLSPNFSASTTNYTVTVDNSVESLNVNAKANNDATVSGTGNISLKVGTNKHTVTVTAADGTKKTYTISIKRLDENETSSENADDTNEDETTADVLAVHLAGKPYHVLSELPESPTAPLGFETSTAEYNGTAVAVYSSPKKEYVLYMLKNDEDGKLDFYTYDSLRDDFILLPYMILNEKMYILATPSETASAPEGYSDTELLLGNTSVRAFQRTADNMTDFYTFYCFADGEFKFYSYDSKEKTVQRAPDFELIEKAPVGADTTPDRTDELSLLQKFDAISTNGKIVVIATVVVAITFLAIIVLLIIRAAKSPRFIDDDGILFEPDDEFDEVNEVASPFRFDSEPEPESTETEDIASQQNSEE